MEVVIRNDEENVLSSRASLQNEVLFAAYARSLYLCDVVLR